MTSSDERKILRDSVFFGSLPDAMFERVLIRARTMKLDAGQILFRQGDQAGSVFCVISGLVKLSIDQRDGSEAVIEIFRPGNSFAEALAFQETGFPATATALVDSRILALPNDALKAELAENPDAFGAILSATYQHLHKLVRQIEQLKANSGTERLAFFILACSDSHQEGDSFDIPFEKQVLASLLGMQPETLSRTFRRLEPHGVAVRGRRIEVASRKRLEMMLDTTP